jgi:hypothetical protein
MDIQDLKDPRFLEWLRATPVMPIEPDDCDVEMCDPTSSDEVLAEAYRRSQARKMMRLYAQWQASQN